MYKIKIFSVLDGFCTEKESENLEDFVECFEAFCYDENNNFSPNNINKHINHLDIVYLKIDNVYTVLKKFEEKHNINLNRTLCMKKELYGLYGIPRNLQSSYHISVQFYYPGREYEQTYWEDNAEHIYIREQIALHHEEQRTHPGTFSNLLISHGLSEEYSGKIISITKEVMEKFGTSDVSKEELEPFRKRALEIKEEYEKKVNYKEPKFETKAWTAEEIKEYKRANRHLFNIVT